MKLGGETDILDPILVFMPSYSMIKIHLKTVLYNINRHTYSLLYGHVYDAKNGCLIGKILIGEFINIIYVVVYNLNGSPHKIMEIKGLQVPEYYLVTGLYYGCFFVDSKRSNILSSLMLFC